MLARHLLRNNLPEQFARLNSTRLLILGVVTIWVGISGWTIALRAMQNWSFPALFSKSPNANYADDDDRRLRQAATAALGERRGTVIVMDPQTGRVRAVINPK